MLIGENNVSPAGPISVFREGSGSEPGGKEYEADSLEEKNEIFRLIWVVAESNTTGNADSGDSDLTHASRIEHSGQRPVIKEGAATSTFFWDYFARLSQHHVVRPPHAPGGPLYWVPVLLVC